MNDLSVLSMQAKKEIEKYNKAVLKCDKSHWELAETVHKTCVNDKFEEWFGTAKDYATYIGISNTNLSKFLLAVNTSEICKEEGSTTLKDLGYTVTQAVELGGLYRKNISVLDFIHENEITPSFTCKEIRELVKNELLLLEDTEADNCVGETEIEDNHINVIEPEKPQSQCVMKIEHNGRVICQIYDFETDTINAVLDIVKNKPSQYVDGKPVNGSLFK